MRHWMTLMALAGLFLAGCGKTDPAVDTAPDPESGAVDMTPSPGTEVPADTHDHGDHDHGDHAANAHGEHASMDHGGVPADADPADICPVSNELIQNKDAFADHNGTRYYFCCNDCRADFEKDPDKYIAQSPAWAEKWSEPTPAGDGAES